MKKFVSIILSLVLVFGIVFSVPTVVSASTLSGADIANSTWTDSLFEAKMGTHIFTAENNSIKFYGWMQYRSFYTKLEGLTPNTTYEITFNYSGIAVEVGSSGIVAATSEKPTFASQIIQGTKYGKFGIDSANKKVTVSFTTDNNTNYFLSIKTGAAENTSAISCFFSNFSIRTVDANEVLSNSIVDGEWLVTGSGSAKNNLALHSVKIDATWHCAYTTIKGFEPNTKYRLNCNYDFDGLYTVYLVNSTLEKPLFNDSVYTNNCSDIAQNISIENGNLSFEFITDEFKSEYTLIFKHEEQKNGAITYSNFNVENLGVYSDVTSALELQNSNWKASSGSVQKNSDGSVTVKTPNAFVYTKLPLLPRESLVKIQMDFNEVGNTVEQLYIVSANEDFNVDQTNFVTYSVENGKITAYFKTSTGRSGYYLGIKHGALRSSGITYNNFNIEVLDNLSDVAVRYEGNNILDTNEWAIQYVSNGKISQDKAAHTLTQSGNSYQEISTVLKNLKPNTTYTISVNYTANDNISGAYIYPISIGRWKNNNTIASWSNDTANQKLSITFVTDAQNTDYYLHFRHGVLENGDITYSNMQLKAENIIFDDAIKGAKIADGEWTAESPGNVKFTHNYVTHTLTQYVNSYQRIYTKLDFLKPNTEYEFTADYTTGDNIQGVYFVTAEQEIDFSNLKQYSKTYTKENGVLKFSFMTSAVDASYYLMIYHEKLSDDSITYSNFKLKEKLTWSNEEYGALLAESKWKSTIGSATVTTDLVAKTVTTNTKNGYLYLQLSGLSLSTSYRITCSYTGKDSGISGVYVCTNINNPSSFLYNKTTSKSYKNNYLQVNFKTSGTNNNYYLAIKLSSSLSAGSITFSNFKFLIPGITTINDEFSDWATPSSSATYSVAENSVTASATRGSIYTKISGLEHNTTYNLQLSHTNLSGVKQFKVFPASESLTRTTYWSNGYYNGKYVDYAYNTVAHNTKNGTTNIVFSTDDTYSNYYLVIELKNGTTVTFSDWSLNKFTELGFTGTAVRRAEPYVRQALRYKNTISASAYENGCFGLELKEFGSIAANTKNLNGLPLVMNESQMIGDASVKKGIAYNATTNKIFETLSDGSKVFTAALINIPYEKYNLDFTVRPYIVLTDGTNDYTIYGTEQVYSVFTVFKLIETYGGGEDCLTVYDILDKKPAVNIAYLNFKGLDSSNVINLSVYNNTVLSNDYKGLSGTVYHSSGYITNDLTGRNYTDEQRQTELKRLSESGVKYCRTRFSPDTIWNSSTNKFNFSASRMQNFIDYCKALESKNISVCLQTSWYLNEILSNNKNNATNTYLNGNGADLYSEQALYSGLIATEYKLSGSAKMPSGETVTEYYNRVGIAAVRYGVYLSNFIKAAKDSGVNNIDYLIYFTEPSYATEDKPEGEFANEYLFVSKTIKNVIEKVGYAEGVKHVGPNQGSVQTGLGLLKYVVTREPELFDVLTAHFYPYSASISDDAYYSQCINAFTSYLQVLKDAGVENKEFWVDEFFAVQKNSSRSARQSAKAALQTVVGSIAAQQLGVENIILWQIFDQAWGDSLETSTEFENGIHMCGTAPSLLVSDVPYAAYYPLSTFMRFNSANSGKSFATSSGKNATSQGVYIGAMEDDNGNLIITVINISGEEKIINVDLQNAINKALYRYSVCEDGIRPTADATPTDCSRIISNVGTSFTDTVLPYSVSIYTTSAN